MFKNKVSLYLLCKRRGEGLNTKNRGEKILFVWFTGKSICREKKRVVGDIIYRSILVKA